MGDHLRKVKQLLNCSEPATELLDALQLTPVTMSPSTRATSVRRGCHRRPDPGDDQRNDERRVGHVGCGERGYPGQVAAATRAMLAGAVAEQLPAGLAAQLLGPAREAFTSGLTTVAGLGAVAVTAFVVLVCARIRPRAARRAAARWSPAGARGAGSRTALSRSCCRLCKRRSNPGQPM
jgi:hypothetical protein